MNDNHANEWKVDEVIIPVLHCPPGDISGDCYITIKTTTEASCQTSLVFNDLISCTDEELKQPAVLRRRFVVDDIKDSNKFYTGSVFYIGIKLCNFNVCARYVKNLYCENTYIYIFFFPHIMIHTLICITGLSLVKLMFLFNIVKEKATRMIYWKGESNTVLDEVTVTLFYYT